MLVDPQLQSLLDVMSAAGGPRWFRPCCSTQGNYEGETNRWYRGKSRQG